MSFLAVALASTVLVASNEAATAGDSELEGFEEVCSAPAGEPFTLSDVRARGPNADAIECMARYGIIQGQEDGDLFPKDRLSRGQVATMLARFMVVADPDLEPPTVTPPYTDIATSVHLKAITHLYAFGITVGVSETEYEPDAGLSRGQMATFLLRTLEALGAEFDWDSTHVFRDVPRDDIHAEAIDTLASAGIIRGTPPSRFAPDDIVERQQAASLLLRSALALHADNLWEPTHNEQVNVPEEPTPNEQADVPEEPTHNEQAEVPEEPTPNEQADVPEEPTPNDEDQPDESPDQGHDGATDDDHDSEPLSESTGPAKLWSDAATWSAGRVPTSDDDVTISGHVVIDTDAQVRGITVPHSSRLEFDPSSSVTLETSGNVVVEGTLRMQPESHAAQHVLRFVGIDESRVVGGHTDSPIASDVGLWIVGDGVLHAEGSDKAAWNRTGSDTSWQPEDDVRVVPMTKGDSTTFARFTPGSPVPTITGPKGDAYAAEVFNLTRNVKIEGGGNNDPASLTDGGRAHVMFLHCNQPQTIRNVELAYMGPRTLHPGDTYTKGIEGRYGLHFHMCHDGSQGSIVESVVVRDTGNSAFVPHTSHGITFRDTISFSTYENAYWWDEGEETNDLVYDRAAAFRVLAYPQFRGYALQGFTLGSGTNMKIHDSVAVGVQGQKANAGGFHWPSSSNFTNNVWMFEDNIAHNNRDAGLSIWQNDDSEHLISRYVGYSNGIGIAHGAYVNSYQYSDVELFNNGTDIRSNALSHTIPQTWSDVTIDGDLLIGNHKLAESVPVIFTDLDLGGTIIVEERAKAGVYEFRSTSPSFDLRREDFEVIDQKSQITVFNSDGTGFDL